MAVRYAKNDVYAEVEEEGGKINRLVAKAGQPVPAPYLDLVNEKDTTTEVPSGRVLDSRSTSARRAAEPPEERSHEEFREVATGQVGEPPQEEPVETKPKRGRKS